MTSAPMRERRSIAAASCGKLAVPPVKYTGEMRKVVTVRAAAAGCTGYAIAWLEYDTASKAHQLFAMRVRTQ